MKVLFGMPSKGSVGGPISSEPPFVKAVERLGVEVEETDFVYGSKIGKKTTFLERVVRVLKTGFRMRRIIKSGGFDVVHLNTAFDRKTVLRDAVILRLIAGVSNAKMLLKLHGSEPQEFDNAGFFWKFLLKSIDKRSDAIGVHTEIEIEILKKLGFNSTRFFVVKNVIPEAEEGYDPPEKLVGKPHRLIFAGRFVEVKCLAETIEAVALLRKDGREVELVCLGDGPEMERATGLVEKHDLGDSVRFTGYIPENEVPDQLKASDVFMFPTRNGEGFPNIFFKSMCFGLPIVTSSFRYADENCIDGEHCVYCETNPASIAAALERLLDDPAMASRIVRNNLAERQSLTGESVAREFVDIYKEIV